MSQFFLTVSSDSTCHFQGSNSTSKFKVHLGRVLELAGEWEVALFEVFYPETFDNVREGDCVIRRENVAQLPNSASLLSVKSECAVTCGYYTTPEALCRALNDCTSDILHFEVDSENGDKTKVYANIVALKDERVTYSLSDGLLDILGFRRDINIEEFKVLESVFPCDLNRGLPKSMKVYSDIIVDQIINNTHEKLLREIHLIPSKFSFGTQKHKNFERLVFLPVAKKKLEYLEFHIKDEQERELSFAHGTLKIILLFRRVPHGF